MTTASLNGTVHGNLFGYLTYLLFLLPESTAKLVVLRPSAAAGNGAERCFWGEISRSRCWVILKKLCYCTHTTLVPHTYPKATLYKTGELTLVRCILSQIPINWTDLKFEKKSFFILCSRKFLKFLRHVSGSRGRRTMTWFISVLEWLSGFSSLIFQKLIVSMFDCF